jgi:hypothetical protein
MAEDSFIDGLPPGGGLQIGDKIPVTRGEGGAAADFYTTLAPEIVATTQPTDYLILVRGSVAYRILVSDFLALLLPPPYTDADGAPYTDAEGDPYTSA